MTFSKAQLKKLKSTIAGATASVFAFTTVSVPVVEANFWQDRQKAARTVADPSSADAGTAESRSLYAGMFKGANPMLLDEKTVDGVAAGARDLVTKGLADLVTPRTTDQKPLPAWMRTLVTPFGEIDDFHVTGSLRNAADWSFDKSADPVIVLIQDVHNVPEAQLNISKIMESYQTRAGLSVVGLEGATGGLLTDKFRAMNAPEALRWASDFLINERVLSGAEYFGLNAPRSATLWGIENEGAYLANVEAYKQTVALRPDVAAFEASANGALAALQEKVYSADLKTFERQRSLYADEKISLSDYVESIAAGPALRAGVNPNAYPNIALFRKAILLEKTIDFKKVEAERTEFLQALTARLSKDDLTRLVALSMEFRLHHVGFGDYYKALSTAAARVKVDLSNTPELKKYVSYALLTDGIARTSFLNEIGRLEDSVTEGLATSTAQKEAARLSRDNVLLHKLLHHNLTFHDWSAFLKRVAELRAFDARLAAAGQKNGVPVAKAEFGFPLAPYEAFYTSAQARNEHFVQNLFDRLRASGARSAVLVAGGFHTEGLRDLLTQKGVGHVVVTPRLTKVDKDDNYLDVFVRDHTPLEKMMLGEKLFIRNTLGLAENAPAGFAGVHDSVTRGLSVLAFAAVLALGAATPREAAAAANSDAAQRALANAPVPMSVTGVRDETVNLTAGNAPLSISFAAADSPAVAAPGRLNAGTAGGLSVSVAGGPTTVAAAGWWDTFQKWIDDLRGAGKKPAAGAATPRFQDFLYQTSPGVEAQRILNDDAVRALLIGIPRNSLPAFYDLLKKDAFLNATNLPPAFAVVQARIWQVFAEGPVRFGSKDLGATPRHPVMDEVQKSLLRSAEQNARNPRYSITSRLDTPDNTLFEAQRILADPALLEMLNKLTPEQIDAVATAPGNGAFIGSPRRQLYGTALGEIIDRVSYLFDNGPFARGGLDARQRLEVVQLVEKKLAEAAKTAAAGRAKTGAVTPVVESVGAPFRDHLLRTSPDIETHRVLTSNKVLGLANDLSIREVETLAALAREGKFLSTRKFDGTTLGDFQANILAGFLRGPLAVTRPDGVQGLSETGFGVLRQAEAELAAAADKVLRMPRYHLGSRLYDDSPFTVDAQRVLADGRLQDLLNGMDAVAVDLLAEAKGDGLLLTDPRTAATSLGPVAQRVIALFNEGAFGTRGHESARNPKPLQIIELRLATAARAAQNARNQPPSTPGRGTPRALLTTLLVGPLAFLPASGAWAADGALRASTDWLSFIGVTVSVAALALGGLLVLAYLSVSPKMPAPLQKFGNAVLSLLNLRRRTSATPTATPAVPAMTLPELIQRIDGLSNPGLGALKANLEAGVVSTPEALAAVSVLLDAGQASLFAKWDAPGTHDDSKRGFLAQVAKMNAEYPGGLTTYAANARVLLEKSARGDNPFKGKTPNAPPMTNLTGRMDEVERYQTAALPSANNLAFVLMAGGMGERLGYNGIKISIPLDLVTETTYMGWYIRHILALQEASNRKTGESKKIPLFIMTSEENHDVTMAFLAEHDYFGMDKEQIIVRQQPLVPAVSNNNADFALDADDPYRLQGKPHGHGDVHMLLHHNGIVKEWEREGRSHVVFIQDTNGQVFNGLLAAVGVSKERDLDVNFLTVDREVGEKTGSITTLLDADDKAVTGNVEYNEIDPLLREFNGRGDVADPKTGKSPFPANLNVLIFKTGPYNEILERTNGIVGEFINPKYADKEKTKFPAARLETMMQTIAFEYQGHGKVAATNFDKRDVFSPVKNNMKTGAENPAKGTYPDAMPTGEADFYKYGRRLLSLAGGLVNVEGKTAQIHGVPYQAGAKVVLYPSFAETIADVKAKVRGTVTVTDRSTLVLDGANITIEGLALDGALIVHAVPGASLAIRGLELRAPARSSDGVYSEVGLADPEVPDYLRIRGYELFPYRDAARVDLTEPGQYVLDRDGNLFRDGVLVRNVNPGAATAEGLAGKISAQSKLSIDAVRDYLSRGPSAGAAAEATFIEGHLAGAMHDFVRSALVKSGVKLNGDLSAVASAVVEEIDAYRDDQGLSFAAAVARFGAENLKQGRPEVARALAADLAVSLPTEADRAPFRHLVKMLDARSQLAPRLEGLKKAYDIRGLTGGKDRLMTPEFVYAAAYTDGLALAKEFPKDTPAVMITGDQRWSTPALRQAAIDGYTAAGAHVYFSNERVSTPAANVVPRLGAFSVEGRPVLFHRVLQISASHDPWLGDASKNGMKMNGRKDFHLRSMEGPQVAAMLEGMFSPEAGRSPDPSKKGRSTEIHILPAYTDFVARRFVAAVEQYGLERADLEKLVFVTDGGQGVMDDVTPGVMEGINRALRERFNDPAFSLAFDSVHSASVRGPDGTVEHPADPVEAGHFADHLREEMDRVRAAHPGKIVVFAVLDGDGDRSGLMGADGKVLSSTQQAFLYFNRLLADRPADRERLRLDIRMGQEILELVGQVTPANQSMIDPGWSKQRRVLLQANAPGGIEGSYHTFVRISDDANTEPMDDGLAFSLDQALYELKLAGEGTSSAQLLAGRSWYPEMSEFRPKFNEAVVDDRYAVMPNITQAIIASVKSEFAAEKANVVVVESREEKGAARIQIYDDAGNFLGWVLMRTSNTNPVLSMKGQGRDAVTLARLKRILKNALENEQFTGRFNQAEIDKGLGKSDALPAAAIPAFVRLLYKEGTGTGNPSMGKTITTIAPILETIGFGALFGLAVVLTTALTGVRVSDFVLTATYVLFSGIFVFMHRGVYERDTQSFQWRYSPNPTWAQRGALFVSASIFHLPLLLAYTSLHDSPSTAGQIASSAVSLASAVFLHATYNNFIKNIRWGRLPAATLFGGAGPLPGAGRSPIGKEAGTVAPGAERGFSSVPFLIAFGSAALAAALTLGIVAWVDPLASAGVTGIWANYKIAIVYGVSVLGMIFGALGWLWYSLAGGGGPSFQRAPIAATPEREILEAAGVRRALTTPKVSVSPEMDKRQLQGGYKQDGTGVPVGAADDGSRARGENAGNQGYYAQGGREAFLKVYRDMRNFFENRAARHGGNPVRLVIKPGIGGQHTPFQGLASVFEVVDPSSGKIVGEYELGKNFSASLEAAVKDLRIGWDQVAVIPSSKSGSTDETMMIFVELLSVLIEKQSSKAFADLFLKTLHDLNFPDGVNERPGKDLFKVDVKEDGFATTSLVELLSHRASQAGLDVNVRDVLGKVLGNMFFETTDRPEQSRLSAFIRNSGLDRDLGADAPGFGAMFDNVGGRWTADLHMLTFLAYHRLDAEAYWTARDAGIAEVVAGTHKAVEIGNRIVDLEIADIALVVPNDLYWYAKSIEQNFNESLWPADAVNERRTPNLVAVRASDWEAQRANYEGRSDVMIIDAVTKDVPPITEENQIYLGAVLNRAASRAALPGMFAQLATTFYGITETVGDRLIARALLRAGYTANDVDMNNLDNPATKIVVDHLYLRQPYVELGKGLLEARLKGIQKEEASNPGALERAQSKIDAQAEAGDVVHNLPGLEVPADRSAPALAGIIRTAVETARAEGRKPLFFLYADGAEFESMRDALIAMGYPWVIQGTGDQHISYQQVLAQPAYYLPIFVSLVSATPQAGRPAIGFAKGYLNNVSPNMVRHFFAEASFEALTSLRADVGGRGLLVTLKDTAENRDALLAGATLAARATATGNFPVRALRSPNANEAPLNAAGAWLSARLTAFGRVPASAVSANDLVTALTALFGVQIHSLGRSVLPTADDAARFLGALAEQNPDARGRDLVATAVQERFAAFRPPQFLPEASDKKTTVFYLDARATDEMIERVDRAVVAAAEAKDGGRVVVLLEPGVESRLSGEMATRPSSRRVTRATLALDGADGLGPVENGVRSLQMASVANRFGFALDNAVVVAPAASLTPIVLPGNSSNNYVNRYVGDGVTVPVSTRFTETLRDVLSKPAPIQTPAARQGGFARVSLLTMIASALGVVAVVVTGTASPAILAVAALPGAVALGLEIRRSVAVQRLIQGLTLYGRLGTLPDGRPSMDAVKAARRLFTGRETGSASTELLVWLAGGALFAAVSLAIGLAPTFFLAGFGLTLFSGRPTMSGRTLSLALVAAGAALFGLPTGAEAAGLFGIPGVAENSPLPWLFGMGGIVLGVAARGVGGDAVELRARDSLKAVDGLLPVARLSEILPDQWTPAKPENQADLQAGLVQFYSAFGGAWLGFAGRAYDALSPAERSRIDVAFLNDADIRRMVSAFNALSRRSPEEARGAFGVYANRVLRALARNATAKSARPDASLLRALGLFLLAQRAELFGTASTEREANAVAVLTRLATLPRPSERNDMTVESSHWDLVPRPSGNTPDIAFVEVDTQDDAGLVRSVISSLHNGAVILAVATDPEAAAQRLARAKETILRDHKQGVLETLRRPDHRHALDSWQDLTRRVVSRSTPGMLDEQGRYSVAGLYKAVPELSKTMGFAPGLFSGENIKYRMSILTGDKTLAHWNQLGVPEIGDLVQFLILEGPKIVRMSLSITQEMEAIHVLSTNA